MKAEDLMLGDFVYGLYPNGERYSSPFSISAVDIYPTNKSPRIVTMGGYGFQQEHLEPIPLTAEILKKNGWKNKLWWEHSDVGFYMSEKTDGTWEIQTDKDSEFSTLCSIRYVHELQHLLRLCGIEKEIEL